MSTDYDIKCRTCNKTLECVASGSIFYGDKLWTGEKEISALTSFLFEHRGHELVFDDGQILDDEE